MLKRIEEMGKFLEITGFRSVQGQDAKTLLSAVRLGLPSEVEVQFFDADLVATWEHVYFAALNAFVAFSTSRNVSKSVAVEVMLYASAQRQITRAIEHIGVKKTSRNVAAIIIGNNSEDVKTGLDAVAKCVGKAPGETVLELTEEKTLCIKRAFGISEAELETSCSHGNPERALVDLVIEKVALLSTQL
jgi:KEOPS complex subunit Cgi121